jgi:hypothetical protein
VASAVEFLYDKKERKVNENNAGAAPRSFQEKIDGWAFGYPNSEKVDRDGRATPGA